MTDTYLYQHPPMAPNPFYGKIGDMHHTPFIRESVQRKPYVHVKRGVLMTADGKTSVEKRPTKAAVKVRRRLRMAMRMFDFARLSLWLYGDWYSEMLAQHYGRRLQALRARL